MKIPCVKCNARMEYPFRVCKKCGWKPEGKYLEKAEGFARLYERKHGIEPRKTERESDGSRPGLVKRPPKRSLSEIERDLDPEIINCPKCGEEIRIPSSKRPLRLTCKKCRAKMKIIE
jgi:hypothetical protein